MERRLADRIPVSLQLRPRRRGAGDHHARVRIQPRPHSRCVDRKHSGGVPGWLDRCCSAQPADHSDSGMACPFHRRGCSCRAPFLCAMVHARICSLSAQQRSRGGSGACGEEYRGESAWSTSERGGDSHRRAREAGSCRSERRDGFRAVRTGASADHSSGLDRLVRFPVGLQWHSLHAADHPDRARHPAHPSD
jgi:hypothetical protein